MHKFDYETMFFSFASLIEKYENNFRDNLMRIYEKLENNKKNLKKIFKKSYGYLITRPNVKFLKNENSEKEIYDIYMHEWGNKNEISFWMKPNWKEKDSLDISYKKILDFFLEDWFKEGTNFSSNREKNLIWTTREIAKISIKMALDYHFIYLFSFFNYDSKKNQKTHYFYNYNNRFFEKQGNNFFNLHQKNKTSLSNSNEFTFFYKFF